MSRKGKPLEGLESFTPDVIDALEQTKRGRDSWGVLCGNIAAVQALGMLATNETMRVGGLDLEGEEEKHATLGLPAAVLSARSYLAAGQRLIFDAVEEDEDGAHVNEQKVRQAGEFFLEALASAILGASLVNAPREPQYEGATPESKARSAALLRHLRADLTREEVPRA